MKLCFVGERLYETREKAVAARKECEERGVGKCAAETFDCVNARMDWLIHWQTCSVCETGIEVAPWRGENYRQWKEAQGKGGVTYESGVYRFFTGGGAVQG